MANLKETTNNNKISSSGNKNNDNNEQQSIYKQMPHNLFFRSKTNTCSSQASEELGCHRSSDSPWLNLQGCPSKHTVKTDRSSSPTSTHRQQSTLPGDIESKPYCIGFHNIPCYCTTARQSSSIVHNAVCGEYKKRHSRDSHSIIAIQNKK